MPPAAIFPYLRYRARLLRRPSRYANLFRLIYSSRSRRIVEVGTWNGAHAIQMIQTAALRHPIQKVEYFGFDLFEALDDELFVREFSKRPPKCEIVRQRLQATGAQIRLHQGNTLQTLPEAVPSITRADFVFVDGGHSLETIESDWNWVRRLMDESTVVVFDDYYHNTDPQVTDLGCRQLIESLDRSVFDVQILEPVDKFKQDWGELKISMAQVQLARTGCRTYDRLRTAGSK